MTIVDVVLTPGSTGRFMTIVDVVLTPGSTARFMTIVDVVLTPGSAARFMTVVGVRLTPCSRFDVTDQKWPALMYGAIQRIFIRGAPRSHRLQRLATQACWQKQSVVSLRVERRGLPLDPAINDEVHLIVREALTNARCHARAAHVSLPLTFGDDQLLVRVRDDGCGVPQVAPRLHA